MAGIEELRTVMASMQAMEQRMTDSDAAYRNLQVTLPNQIAETNHQFLTQQQHNQQLQQTANEELFKRITEASKLAEEKHLEIKTKFLEAEEKEAGKEVPNSDGEDNPPNPPGLKSDPMQKRELDPWGKEKGQQGTGSDNPPNREQGTNFTGHLEEKSFRRIEKFSNGDT